MAIIAISLIVIFLSLVFVCLYWRWMNSVTIRPKHSRVKLELAPLEEEDVEFYEWEIQEEENNVLLNIKQN